MENPPRATALPFRLFVRDFAHYKNSVQTIRLTFTLRM